MTKDKGQHQVLESVSVIPERLREFPRIGERLVWLRRCYCGGYWFQLVNSRGPRHVDQ